MICQKGHHYLLSNLPQFNFYTPVSILVKGTEHFSM